MRSIHLGSSPAGEAREATKGLAAGSSRFRDLASREGFQHLRLAPVPAKLKQIAEPSNGRVLIDVGELARIRLVAKRLLSGKSRRCQAQVAGIHPQSYSKMTKRLLFCICLGTRSTGVSSMSLAPLRNDMPKNAGTTARRAIAATVGLVFGTAAAAGYRSSTK